MHPHYSPHSPCPCHLAGPDHPTMLKHDPQYQQPRATHRPSELYPKRGSPNEKSTVSDAKIQSPKCSLHYPPTTHSATNLAISPLISKHAVLKEVRNWK